MAAFLPPAALFAPGDFFDPATLRLDAGFNTFRDSLERAVVGEVLRRAGFFAAAPFALPVLPAVAERAVFLAGSGAARRPAALPPGRRPTVFCRPPLLFELLRFDLAMWRVSRLG